MPLDLDGENGRASLEGAEVTPLDKGLLVILLIEDPLPTTMPLESLFMKGFLYVKDLMLSSS